MIRREMYLSGKFQRVQELLFAVLTAPGLSCHPLPLQPPEPPGVLEAGPDNLLKEPAGGLEVQQGGEVQIGQEQGDHRSRNQAGQQTHRGLKHHHL